MLAEFGKYGPRFDYRGAHVGLTIGVRRYLGEVLEVYRNDVRRQHLAKVRYFNGEPWPFDPALSALEILERTEG